MSSLVSSVPARPVTSSLVCVGPGPVLGAWVRIGVLDYFLQSEPEVNIRRVCGVYKYCNIILWENNQKN